MKKKSLSMFEQHGFVQAGEVENQIFGQCPFCLRTSHFYINIETKQWDCKSCGKAGGFQIFLQEIVNHCQQYFKQKPAIALSRERGLKINTLRKAGLGYNSNTDTYIIPIKSPDEKEIQDVRLCKLGKNVISTKDCKVGLFGWDNINSDTIWLCEGEWDAIAMREVLEKVGIKQTVLAVPGANTFKGEWVNIFRGKAVHVLYDNDEAGREGAIKVYNMLNAVADSLKFINWPAKYGVGFDIRDYYHLKKDKLIKSLTSIMEMYPDGAEVPEVEKLEYKGKGVRPEAVYKTYKKWLKFPKDDTTVLDVLFGVIIANRFPGEPLWMFIVAPSGGMKSELLMTLIEAKEIFSASSISPHALISGANFGTGGDPSLVPKLNKKVFVVKDFTVILSMNSNDREEIFGILRDCYDGHSEKQFGNGIFRVYKSKFGILAGVTPKIDEFTEEHVALGERFIRYKIPISRDLDDRMEIIFKAMSNVASEDTMRKELSDLVLKILNYDFGELPEISPEIERKINGLAMWTSLLRSSVTRDKYTKEVLHYPSDELGTRLAKQFKKLIFGISLFRRLKKVGDAEYNIVKGIALNTVPTRTERIISGIYNQSITASYSDAEIANMIELPSSTTKRLIENLYMLQVLKKQQLSSIKTKWSLTDGIIHITEIAEVYKK